MEDEGFQSYISIHSCATPARCWIDYFFTHDHSIYKLSTEQKFLKFLCRFSLWSVLEVLVKHTYNYYILDQRNVVLLLEQQCLWCNFYWLWYKNKLMCVVPNVTTLQLSVWEKIKKNFENFFRDFFDRRRSCWTGGINIVIGPVREKLRSGSVQKKKNEEKHESPKKWRDEGVIMLFRAVIEKKSRKILQKKKFSWFFLSDFVSHLLQGSSYFFKVEVCSHNQLSWKWK